jgi:hypothetical protein
MNKQQALDLAAKVIAIAGGYAVGHGWISSDQVVMIGGIVAAVIPLIYSYIANSQKAQVKAVEEMPGVSKIVTNEQANVTLASLVTDPTHPKVQ